jgi:hypothetical protein
MTRYAEKDMTRKDKIRQADALEGRNRELAMV